MAILEPMHDIIVIKPTTKPTTQNSFITSTTTQEEPDRGTVIAVGPGRYVDGAFVPTTLTVGDCVLYVKGSGAFVKLGDDVDKIVVLPESNIIGKIV